MDFLTGQDIISNQSAKIYLFCCSSSFDASELLRSCGEPGDNLKVIPLPCSGKIDFLYLIKAFENGADGVAVLVCKHGECRYLEGNLRARKRVEAVNTLLEELGMDKGHIVLIQMNDDGIEQVIREVDNFRTRIKTLSRSC